ACPPRRSSDLDRTEAEFVVAEVSVTGGRRERADRDGAGPPVRWGRWRAVRGVFPHRSCGGPGLAGRGCRQGRGLLLWSEDRVNEVTLLAPACPCRNQRGGCGAGVVADLAGRER